MTTTVPGSEKFANVGIKDADILATTRAAGLGLHTVGTQEISAIDPLTHEVIRHRLWAITDEMGEAIKRMSGSVVVTDCNDFDAVICDELGDEVQVGLYNTHLCASTDMFVKWTLQHRSSSPGIRAGDQFICNDPWVGGGLHQNDVAVAAPVFWEGEVFAWVASVAHQVDLGGAAPGSMDIGGTDVFSESVPIPPTRIVADGQLLSDIEDMYLRRSRVPKLVALDLRAKVGANNLAVEQITKLIEKYGPTTVKAVMKRVMSDAETRLRAKLRELPDGTWTAVAHQDQAREGDREVYKIVVAMSKRDDQLTFDFTGTDPQVEGLINCTFGGLRAGVLVAVLPLLCGDIPWATGGIDRCIEYVTEPGTLNNCTFPASISKAPVASTWATTNAAIECLSAMLETTPKYRERAIGVCSGTWPMTIMSGQDQRGNPFVTMLCDAMAGGLGARTDQDGVDTGGQFNIPMGRMADVEMNEFVFPMLYLWRREEIDSGGPGRFRGGVGGSSCFVAHDTEARGINLLLSASGKAIPQSPGISGGYPGNTTHDVIVRGSDIREIFTRGELPTALDQVGGEEEILQPEGQTLIGWDDVYCGQWEAGAGYGDPLRRDPARVAHDLHEHKVSSEAASATYGVVFAADGTPDESATEERRQQLRRDRAGV